jgi:hypothetical protein
MDNTCGNGTLIPALSSIEDRLSLQEAVEGEPLKERTWAMSVQEPMLSTNQAFVVQFRSKLNLPLGQFEGRAEHIASGRVTRFSSQQQLFDFIVDLLKQYPVSNDEADD